MIRTSHTLAGLGLALVLAGPAAADTAEVLAQIEADFVSQRQVFDQHRRDFELVRRRAAEVKVDLRIARDPKLDLEPAPSSFGPLEPGAMVAYLPTQLLKDLRRRIATEYRRGADEWLGGYWPPIDYQAHSGQTMRWTQQIFGEWDRDTIVFGLPLSLRSLYVEPAGAGKVNGNFDRLVEQLPALRRAAEQALETIERFEPQVEWGWTWFPPFRQEKLVNKDEWHQLRHQAEVALENYRYALVTMRNSADAHVRSRVEQAVDYANGDQPSLGFLDFVADLGSTNRRLGRRQAPGGVFARYWEYWFDEQVLRALPGSYLSELDDRLVKAYFLGARDAKHDQRTSTSNWGEYGTGDGYGWGDSTRYRASGSRRTPGYWDRGTGDGGTGGTGGTGTGSGTGTGGTGTGDDGHGPFLPGPGTGGDPFGLGTGSGSGSGTGGTGIGTGGTGGGTSGGGLGTGTGTGS